MTSESVKDVVFRLLDERRGEWPTISAEAGVGYWWILKFMGRKIADPGYDKIDRLHRYFQDKGLGRPTADVQKGVGMQSVATPTDAAAPTVEGEAA